MSRPVWQGGFFAVWGYLFIDIYVKEFIIELGEYSNF